MRPISLFSQKAKIKENPTERKTIFSKLITPLFFKFGVQLKKLTSMNKLIYSVLLACVLIGCKKSTPDETTENTQKSVVDKTEELASAILQARHSFSQTDLLSRELPNITRKQAFDIQLKMLEKELAEGKKLVGYKMGGTVVADAASYDPMFGYMLDSNVIAEDSTIVADNFPGGDVMVEAEIGFRLKKDFPNGVKSIEELKAGIDYVFNAIEFAKPVSIPINSNAETMSTNHIIGTGLANAGVILGSGKSNIDDFDPSKETAICLINGENQAEGIATNIYGGPINAVFSLANLLPEYGKFLRKGDVVITGSLYKNPTIDGTCEVKVSFSTLGDINFKMK